MKQVDEYNNNTDLELSNRFKQSLAQLTVTEEKSKKLLKYLQNLVKVHADGDSGNT